MAWMDHVIQARWIEVEDKCSRLFFKTFKGMSTDTEIKEVLDSDGRLRREWDSIAEATKDLFLELLSTSQGLNAEQLQWVLEQQTKSLSVEDKAVLNHPLMVEELQEAVKALAKEKTPGADGIPVEFFLFNWEVAGSALHRAILLGLQKGALHFEFVIVLLCKNGD